MSAAILLIAHGSRRAEANYDLVLVAEKMRERVPGKNIEVSYLELAEPSIPQGLQACVEKGASEIRMLPYFLSAGSHVTRDLEGFKSDFLEVHPHVKCTLCPPLGLHPQMIDILLDRLNEEYSNP